MKKISENGYSLFLTRLSFSDHVRSRNPLSTLIHAIIPVRNPTI